MDYKFDSVEVMERKRRMRRVLRFVDLLVFVLALIAWIPHARELGLWGSLKFWVILLPVLVISCWLGRIRAMTIVESIGNRGCGSPKKKDVPPPPGKEHILARALTRTPRGK